MTGWTPAPSGAAPEQAEPAQTGTPPHPPKARYDQDEFGWLLEQADLLRDGRLAEIDRVSLIEFLTDVARSKKHEFRGMMIVLLHHLLKVVTQPKKVTRSWLLTIVEQQQEAQFLIEDEPGIRQHLPDLYAKAYPVARRRASIETGIGIDRFPQDNPWTMDAALTFVPPAPPRHAVERAERLPYAATSAMLRGAGRLARKPAACSKAWAARNRVASRNGLAATCTLTGRPSAPKPEQTHRAGQPVRLNGAVKLGRARLSHFGTASMRGASAGAPAVTRRSRSCIAAVVAAHNSRRIRSACT